MPANLNALIRYKTINSCLYGGRRRWSIDELRDKCSEALAESRGRYTGVSERTMRDDIRVMRSDILGFNAPIKQEGGLYFYSDPRYSILNLSVTDEGLAEQIYSLLMKLRGKVSHPELEMILMSLCRLLGRVYEPFRAGSEMGETLAKRAWVDKALHGVKEKVRDEAYEESEMITDSNLMNYNYLIKEEEIKASSVRGNKMAGTASRRGRYELLWRDILELLSGQSRAV